MNSRFWRVAIPAVLVVQFALSAYDPRHYLPTQADRAAGDRLLEALRSSEGPAMMPVHGGYQRRTGHAPSAHVLAVMDIERGPDPELGKRLRAEFLAHSWSADCDLIVLNEPGAEDYGALLVRDPNKIEWRFEPLFDDPKNPDGTPQLQENGRPVFMPVVGLQTRPMQVWRRIR